jgi:hypothetical protein
MGCTLNCDPNRLSVFSPTIDAIATRALNFGTVFSPLSTISPQSTTPYYAGFSNCSLENARSAK